HDYPAVASGICLNRALLDVLTIERDVMWPKRPAAHEPHGQMIRSHVSACRKHVGVAALAVDAPLGHVSRRRRGAGRPCRADARQCRSANEERSSVDHLAHLPVVLPDMRHAVSIHEDAAHILTLCPRLFDAMKWHAV